MDMLLAAGVELSNLVTTVVSSKEDSLCKNDDAEEIDRIVVGMSGGPGAGMVEGSEVKVAEEVAEQVEWEVELVEDWAGPVEGWVDQVEEMALENMCQERFRWR